MTNRAMSASNLSTSADGPRSSNGNYRRLPLAQRVDGLAVKVEMRLQHVGWRQGEPLMFLETLSSRSVICRK
jgi:hypothetical protein